MQYTSEAIQLHESEFYRDLSAYKQNKMRLVAAHEAFEEEEEMKQADLEEVRYSIRHITFILPMVPSVCDLRMINGSIDTKLLFMFFGAGIVLCEE